MQQENILISSIKINDKNPRKISNEDMEKLINSIKLDPEILTVNPIVLNSSDDLTVLAGQMRFIAIKKLKYKSIPKSWLLFADNITEEQKKKFIILDNTHYGTWDLVKLSDEWETDLSNWNITIPDFNEADIKDLLPVDDSISSKHVKPLASSNEYSVFEIVMLHNNKLLLLDFLNYLKNKFKLEKLEDVLMHIINNFKK